MKYYRSNRKSSGNKRKILFRILYVLAAAIIITTVTILIGNSLKKKVEKAEEDAVTPKATTGLQTERHLEESSIYSEYSPSVFGASVVISDYIGTDDTDEAPRDIAADVRTLSSHFDTLSINIVSDSGELIYESEAMCALSRIPYSGTDETEALIKSALEAAKNNSMRTTAVFVPMVSETTISGAAAVDSALITELSEMGFDEVLLDLSGMFGDDITYDAASRVRTYVHECSSLTNDTCKIGVALSADVFLNSADAKQIQLIANAASFIAVKFDLDEVYITTEAYDMASDAVTSLLGNFSVYNMRVIIDSRFDIISAAVYSACKEHGVTNVSFSTFILPEALGYSDDTDDDDDVDTGDGQTDPEDSELPENPYATTTDNPSIGAPAKTKDDTDDTDDNTVPADSDGEDDDNGESEEHPWY